MNVWECADCEVSGRDPGEATCWSCGSRDVVVTARVAISGGALEAA